MKQGNSQGASKLVQNGGYILVHAGPDAVGISMVRGAGSCPIIEAFFCRQMS